MLSKKISSERVISGTKIVSLRRWNFSLVNGGFRKLRTECSELRHYHAKT